MSQLLTFKNFLSKADTIDLVEKNSDAIPMIYNESEDTWYIDIQDIDIFPESFQFKLLIDKKHYINHPSYKHIEYSPRKFVSIYNKHQTKENVIEKVEIGDLFTFSIYQDKPVKKSNFTPNDEMVFLGILLKNKCNVLLTTEWINPNKEVVYISDYVLKPSEYVDNFLIIHKDNLCFGKWTIYIYVNGQKIETRQFMLSKFNQYYKPVISNFFQGEV
jgi:hypothetical protein